MALAHRIDRAPMRGRLLAIERADRPEQKRAGAYTRRHFGGHRLRANPVEHRRILPLFLDAKPAGNDEQIEMRVVAKRVMRLDEQPAPAHDDIALFGNRVGVIEPTLVARRIAGVPGGGEYLERPAKIEHFHIIEHENPDIPALALGHWSSFQRS